ncbi:MAG: MFS transporter [Chloroflexi bacterium]|nr:MFS transporter [Chloroflexota bacterium]
MRKYLIVAVVAIPAFMGNLDATVVAVAFPTLVSEFGSSLVLAGWVMSVYTLVSIGAIPVASRLSDTHGRKSTFVVSLALFTVGSFLCAVAPSIGWLIFFRAIQAAGGGAFLSVATGITSDMFSASRQRLIGLIVSIANFGSVAGPNIGGVMVAHLGWRSIFWVNVPIGIVALILCLWLIKADVRKAIHSEVDLPGIGLLMGFVSALMISFTLVGHDYGVPLFVVPLTIMFGLLLLVLFIYRCKRRPGGLISPEVLSGRPFMAANLFNFVYGTCSQSGVLSLVPLYAVSVYGMTVIESGLVVTPRSLGLIAASVVASLFILKWGYRRPLVAGTLGSAFGFAALALEPGGISLGAAWISPAILVMLLSLVVGIGAGVVIPASTNACIDLMPDKVASIVGFRQLVARIGGSFAIAVSTLVLQSGADMARGFTWVFMGASALLLLSIAAAFVMPAGPGRQT